MKKGTIVRLRIQNFLLAAITTGALIAAGPISAQTAYSFADIGVLDPSFPYAYGLGINNSGQVIVRSRTTAGTARICQITPAVDGSGHQVWTMDVNGDGVNDLMRILPLPTGFTYSTGWAGNINSSGQAVGMTQASANMAPQCAVVWTANGTPTLLTSTKNHSGNGFGINDGGDVVGGDSSGNTPSVPYLWQFFNGSYTAVQLSTSGGYATAINNFRQVIGPNFLWLPSPAFGLPKGMNLLSGINIQAGKNINNAGLIVGSTPSGHLCVWTPPGGGAPYNLNDGLNDLGISSLGSVYPYGLTNPPAGQPVRVVGNTQDAAGNISAFVWDSGSRTIRNLNAITVNLPAGWALRSANGINDLGQIVGTGTYNGITRAFVLTPL